jgi:uncharacterized membrane protein YhaH (DUF805 family)
MNFGEALDSTLIKKYAVFSGRACRAEWFYFLLFSVLLTFIVSMVGAFFSVSTIDVESLAYLKWISLAIGVVLLIPSFSVTVRRLQDLNLSYFWVIPFVIGSILSLYTLIDMAGTQNARLSSISMLISIIYIIGFLRKGDAGKNRFGNDPLEPKTDSDTY